MATAVVSLEVRLGESLLDIRELWIGFALKVEPASEKVPNALDVSVEIVLGVEMRCADHLRKVDQRDLVFVTEHHVELVEIAMDETVVGQM